MSEKNNDNVVRAVRFDRALWEAIDGIATHTGIKAADLHRLALSRLVEHVKETGRVPIPAMPAADGGLNAEGGAA